MQKSSENPVEAKPKTHSHHDVPVAKGRGTMKKSVLRAEIEYNNWKQAATISKRVLHRLRLVNKNKKQHDDYQKMATTELNHKLKRKLIRARTAATIALNGSKAAAGQVKALGHALRQSRKEFGNLALGMQRLKGYMRKQFLALKRKIPHTQHNMQYAWQRARQPIRRPSTEKRIFTKMIERKKVSAMKQGGQKISAG